MVEKSSESRVIKVKRLNADNDSFLPNDIVCVDDFEELSAAFEDSPIITKKFNLLRKIIEKIRHR